MTTFAQDADGRRLAARHLLATPILTAARRPDEFALVRRHATALASMFATLLGYRLVVESSFARLVKVSLDERAPVRPARRASDDAEFGASSYVVLALVCAALLAPGVGEQLLISALVDQIRSDAADHDIAFGDSIGDRRRLVGVIGMLAGWGVLSETDGSVAAWGERRQDEALLTIDRTVLAHLLPSPLHQFREAREVYSHQEGDQPRRRLRRRLVENPVVFRVELDDAERDVLSRERADLTRQLEENFGLTLEVRAEGALAYDAAGTLTDIEFPGTGSRKQAALLLIDALVAEFAPDDPAAPVIVAWSRVTSTLTELAESNRKVWKGAYVDSVAELQRDVVALLSSLSLAEATETGLLVHPPAARYRPAVRRIDQPTLFGGAP